MSETANNKYQIFDDLDDATYQALRDSIQRDGFLVPVEYDEEGEILDGHHRVKACLELGISAWPKLIRQNMTEPDKKNHARVLNINRRHLTTQQREKYWKDMRDDGMSLEAIAKADGTVSHETIRSVFKNLQTETPTKTKGKDGKSYPQKKPRKVKTVYKPADTPHVAKNSGENEWYTPSEYIEAARQVMGSIDTDPASSNTANQIVKASLFYTSENNGLDKEWTGNVWMNPPYSSELINQFTSRFVLMAKQGKIQSGILLVNNATETGWFQEILTVVSAVCFIKGRVKFLDMGGKASAPLQGQALLYYGNDADRFIKVFAPFGEILINAR